MRVVERLAVRGFSRPGHSERDGPGMSRHRTPDRSC